MTSYAPPPCTARENGDTWEPSLQMLDPDASVLLHDGAHDGVSLPDELRRRGV